MRILMFAVLLLAAPMAFSQVKAITEEGKEVVLYTNGTWKFIEEPVIVADEGDTIVANTPDGASFELKGELPKFRIRINPAKWEIKKGEEGVSYIFKFRRGDAYVMLIAEEYELPIDQLLQVAVKTALKNAPDLKVVKTQNRVINNIKLKSMQMEGTVAGIKAGYFSYYYSNSGGTIQLVGFTAKKLYPKYQPEIEELLNGFAGIDKAEKEDTSENPPVREQLLKQTGNN